MEIVHVQVYSNCVCARARGRGREQTCVCENEKMVGMYFLYFTNDTNGDTTQTYKPAPESMFMARARQVPRAPRRRRRQSTMRPSCCS